MKPPLYVWTVSFRELTTHWRKDVASILAPTETINILAPEGLAAFEVVRSKLKGRVAQRDDYSGDSDEHETITTLDVHLVGLKLGQHVDILAISQEEARASA